MSELISPVKAEFEPRPIPESNFERWDFPPQEALKLSISLNMERKTEASLIIRDETTKENMLEISTEPQSDLPFLSAWLVFNHPGVPPRTTTLSRDINSLSIHIRPFDRYQQIEQVGKLYLVHGINYELVVGEKDEGFLVDGWPKSLQNPIWRVVLPVDRTKEVPEIVAPNSKLLLFS